MNSRHEQRLAEFMVHGPSPLPTTGRAASRELDRDAFSEFWKHTTPPDLSRKVGCYVFAMRVGKSYRPYPTYTTIIAGCREAAANLGCLLVEVEQLWEGGDFWQPAQLQLAADSTSRCSAPPL
jgi:hypothetical protein